MIPALLLTLSISALVAPVPPPGIDPWIARAMRTFEVPGLALAIVKDDEVVPAKGYGVRTLGDATPVDARTLFGIASNTKAFTATALGLLVEEGRLEWDAPVVRYLPAFAMWDPFVTREIADAYVTFALNPDGSIDQVKMRAVSPATDFSFDVQDLLLRPVR
jgi:CubicO group peptidase (beta-lactamase class C family)